MNTTTSKYTEFNYILYFQKQKMWLGFNNKIRLDTKYKIKSILAQSSIKLHWT